MNSWVVAIMIIDSEQAFENIRQTLSNYDWSGKFKVLCLTNEYDLYDKTRWFLAEASLHSDKEFLVEYVDHDMLTFEDGKQFIQAARYVFLWDNRTIPTHFAIENLIKTAEANPSLGIACGEIKAEEDFYFNAEDIYANKVVCTSAKMDGRLTKIDATTMASIITSYKNYKAFDFAEHSIFEFCITLRQLGYNNYLDREIEIKI